MLTECGYWECIDAFEPLSIILTMCGVVEISCMSEAFDPNLDFSNLLHIFVIHLLYFQTTLNKEQFI